MLQSSSEPPSQEQKEQAMKTTTSPIYRWRVGEVEITRVLEFEAALFEPAVIHPEASPEIIERHRSWLTPTLMDPTGGLMIFAFHSTIIKTPRTTILVDTCSGNDKERPHKLRYHRKNWPYLANLAAAGFVPEGIDYMRARICTPITSVGTRGSSMADGCRPSRMPATCSPSRNGSTGGWLNGEPHTPPIRTTRTVCCRSWRMARPSWSPLTMPSTTAYGSRHGRDTHPAMSAS
jgi:hypothetical protein